MLPTATCSSGGLSSFQNFLLQQLCLKAAVYSYTPAMAQKKLNSKNKADKKHQFQYSEDA
jgi:hypothetical protein